MDSDEEMIHHFSHQHPLCWIPKLVAESMWSKWCYGCGRYLSPGEEAVYGCKDNCAPGCYLHEDCAEMPRQIRHAVHPLHLLTLTRYSFSFCDSSSCAACEGRKYGLIYICSEGCAIWFHMECAGGSDAADDPKTNVVQHHPSHPRHELRLLRRKKGSCSFQCNACGTIEKGNSYICSICDYWIHESCANLPMTADFPLHHPHSLSLSFYPPYEYTRYDYTCGICDGVLKLRRWVYHCHLCRYVVHVKCATNTNPAATPTHQIGTESTSADDHKDAIKGPINNIYEELIKAFVKNQIVRDDIFIPNEKDSEIISGKYKFHKHDHSLSFTKFSSHDHDQNEEAEEEEEEEEDDSDDNILQLASVTCDACTLPIHQKSSGTSSSSYCSYEYDDSGYMFCGECDYFLHLACFNLPPELSSHPLHPIEDHKLTLLQKSNKLKDWSSCGVCRNPTNGLFYACTKCNFRVDVKCASLPDTMKHAGHPRPHHFLKLVVGNTRTLSICGACYTDLTHNLFGYQNVYSCDSCKFLMCLECVFLPASNKHRLEKHRLPLTYDASVNHPSEFYCGSCEKKMNPRMWMYHCRDCDQSFHPKCFPATSGWYRNINFGSHEYNMNVTTFYHHPHHPLKFQIITKKKYCDLCRGIVYEKPGFQCAACNFVSCTEEHPNVFITFINSQ